MVKASKDHAHPVSQTNPAWVDAKELKERASPPLSIVASKMKSLVVGLHYSSPKVKGRKIWGNLVPYNDVWRTGANEATMLELSNDAEIGGKTIPAGRYSLFTIPGENDWKVIINGVFDQWGAFEYSKHQSQNIHTFNVKPSETSFSEDLNFSFIDETEASVKLQLKWDKLAIAFPIKSNS